MVAATATVLAAKYEVRAEEVAGIAVVPTPIPVLLAFFV